MGNLFAMGNNQASTAATNVSSIAQDLYNEREGADVWFIIGDAAPIPGHHWVLKAMVPLYNKNLPNGSNEIHLSGVSVAAFMQFLKCIHLIEPTLTMEIIEGVMHMANLWQSEPIFEDCKQFLGKTTAEKSTLFLGYRLAEKYQLKDLKALYLEEICVNAYAAFRTDGIWNQSFLTLPKECVMQILQCDSLACKEYDVNYALVAWARETYIQNGVDLSTMKEHLDDLLHQIRFTSMTNKEAAKCIDSNPELFTEDELKEILCMIGQEKQFKPKQFNWKERYYNLKVGKKDLVCSRLLRNKTTYNIENAEQVTRFTCNRRIELHAIEFEWFNRTINCSIPLRIVEIDRNEQISIRYDKTLQLNSNDGQGGNFFFNNGIILRPNYTYEIYITFPNLVEVAHSVKALKEAVRVDHDIDFRFTKRGAVYSLTFRRCKNKSFIRKIVYDPTLWIWILVIMIILGSIASFYIWPYSFHVFKYVLLIILFYIFVALICSCCI